jgi:putative DNA primase/helicase
MVILEGHQGTFKTSALRAIGGQWHKEINTSVKGTDFFVALQGVLIAEICEMDSFNHAEVTRIKSIITCTVDHYRPPYGRCVIDRPRRCVFVGTTNSDNYLRDETGGRRFWPIKCGIINLERIESMREQLYAEAVHRYKAGEAWYVMPGDITKEMQDSRRHQDLWEEIVREFIDEKPRNQITLQEIAEQCLDIKTEKWDLRTAHRLGTIMRALGWESRVIREGHSTRRVWVNTNTSADRPF